MATIREEPIHRLIVTGSVNVWKDIAGLLDIHQDAGQSPCIYLYSCTVRHSTTAGTGNTIPIQIT